MVSGLAFKRMIDTDKKDQELFELCLPLEGLPRHISVHAAGVVLSDQDIEKVCPLVRIDEENTARIGDFVQIVETRPLSKNKCWRLDSIITRSVESTGEETV